MDDLISRQAAIDAMGERPLVWNEWADEYELGQRNQYDSDRLAVESVPSAEPERKTGHWIEHYGDSKCSECGYVLKIHDTNYCPDCGSYNGGEEK